MCYLFVLAAKILLLSSSLEALYEEERQIHERAEERSLQRRRHRIYRRLVFVRRETVYENKCAILEEYEREDHEAFQRALGVEPTTFQTLLDLIDADITMTNPITEPIPSKLRLQVYLK